MAMHRKTRKIASFDIDPQKGFTELCNELQVKDGHLILDELKLNHEFASIKVVSRDTHPTNPHWLASSRNEMGTPVKGDNVDISWVMHCELGTKGAELLDGLPHPIMGYDYCVSKGLDVDMHPYGACFHDLNDTKSTGVIEFLKVRDICTIIVGGLSTDFCVRLTVLQLLKADFEVILNLNACRAVTPEGGITAITDMEHAGAIICNNANELSSVLHN